MSPSARLIGYYIDSNERIAADSILLDIKDKLPTKVMETDIEKLANERQAQILIVSPWISGMKVI